MIVHHICPPKTATFMASEHGVIDQLLLAQEWELDDPVSLRHFTGSAGSIIMDNGSWEGKLVSLKHMLTVAERHDADYVVLPDFGGDPASTRAAAVIDAPVIDAEGFKPIAALQALDLPGLAEDLKLYNSLGIEHVGLPGKLMYPAWDGTSRIEVLRDLVPELERYGMKVHLLGLMERPNELREIAQDVALNDFVVSVDTAAALRWAMADRYPTWGTQLHVPRWIWENLTLEDLPEQTLWLWKHNMETLETWARRPE